MRQLKNLLVLLLLIALVFSLAACAEDIEPKENEEMLLFTYESFTFMNSRENEIEETMAFLNTKSELDDFCELHGHKIGEFFLTAASKYEDAFFEENTLLWVNYGLRDRVTNIDLTGIKRISIDGSVGFSVYIHAKMLTGMHPDAYTGDICFLVEVKGKHEMTKYNTTVNKTSEDVPLSEVDIIE